MSLGRLAALLGLVGLAAAVAAQTPAIKTATAAPASKMPAEAGPAWAQLPAAQQAALAPLHGQWRSLDANRKDKWIAVAQRFPALPAAERQRVQARMAEWARLSPAERGRARQNFQELRNLHVDDRQALWEAYRSLPAEQQRELAQRARPAVRASEPAATVKRNVPVNTGLAHGKSVTPTVVQARPGATTNLVTKAPAPPVHNQPGLPKIVATEGFVNRSTLLPKRGPQGAAALAPPASAASDSHRRP